MPPRPTGHPAPSALGEAREQVRQATRLVATVGPAFLLPRTEGPPHPLRWLSPDGGLLASLRVEAATPFAVALRLRDLALLVLDGLDRPVAVLLLPGRTGAEALEWLVAAVEAFAGAVAAAPVRLPELAGPEHPVAAGAPFAVGDAAGRLELARWLGLGGAAMDAVVDARLALGLPTVDPASLRLAVRVALAGGDRSVELAFSPGDDELGEPYFVGLPRPAAIAGPLPPLVGGGEWHRGAWTGAVLRGSALLRDPDPLRGALAFLDAAGDACRLATPRLAR